MGRIKIAMIKRTTKELMKKELVFSEHFNDNKKILGSTMPSKKVRNKIAGYIGRLKRVETKTKQAEALRLAQPPAQVIYQAE